MKIVCRLFIIIILPIIFGSNKPDSIERVMVKDKAVDSNFMSESKAYKLLYENQVKSNDAVLKTIFYALGGLGTAILLVFGSNWWFNDKKVKDIINENQTKIENIKKNILAELQEKINNISLEKISEINKLQVKLKDEITAYISEFGLKYNEFIEKTRDEIKDDKNTLQNSYQDLLKSYNDNLNQQIITIKESFDEKTKLLTNQIEENYKKSTEKFTNEYNNIKREILLHNADIAYLAGSNYVAFKSYLDLALFDSELNQHWRFKYTSDDILKCLKKIDNIYSDYGLIELNSLIEIYKEKYSERIAEIEENLKNKNIKKLMKERTDGNTL